jgi:hypothetical protein
MLLTCNPVVCSVNVGRTVLLSWYGTNPKIGSFKIARVQLRLQLAARARAGRRQHGMQALVLNAQQLDA